MSLTIRVTETFDINTGETFVWRDFTGIYDPVSNPTGYGGPNLSINAINKVRLLWSSYLTEQAASTSTTIEAGKEYIVSGASLTFNGKTYTVGQTFVSMIDVTPTLGSSVVTETGRFTSDTDFLPIQTTSSDFTPSLCGIDSTIFPDSAYEADYELYDTVWTAGSVSVSGSTQYIVKGTAGQTVTISGVVYYPNEVFTKSTGFSFTGAASIVEYATATSDSFYLPYYAYQAIKSLNLRIAQSTCGCKEEMLEALTKCWAKYQAIQYNYDNNVGLAPSIVQDMLTDIVTIATTALNQNC